MNTFYLEKSCELVFGLGSIWQGCGATDGDIFGNTFDKGNIIFISKAHKNIHPVCVLMLSHKSVDGDLKQTDYIFSQQ